jgi:hypothetical protein
MTTDWYIDDGIPPAQYGAGWTWVGSGAAAREFLSACGTGDGFIPSVKVVETERAGDTERRVSTVFWTVEFLDEYLAEHPDPRSAVRAERLYQARRKGHDISTILGQDAIWVDKADCEHQLVDMSLRYKAAVLGFLEARASILEFSDAMSTVDALADLGDDAPDGLIDHIATRDAGRWLQSRPLVKELRRQVDAGIGGTDGD